MRAGALKQRQSELGRALGRGPQPGRRVGAGARWQAAGGSGGDCALIRGGAGGARRGGLERAGALGEWTGAGPHSGGLSEGLASLAAQAGGNGMRRKREAEAEAEAEAVAWRRRDAWGAGCGPVVRGHMP